MALQILLIMFIIMAVVSVLGIYLLYLVKNPKSKNIIFYSLSIWALFVTFINVTALPLNYILERGIAWSFGILSILAVAIKIIKPEKTTLSYLLVSSSILLGLVDLFFF